MDTEQLRVFKDSELIEEKLSELKNVLLIVDKIYLRNIGLQETEDESAHVDSFVSMIRRGEKDWWNFGSVSLVTNALRRVCEIAMKKGDSPNV